MTIKRENLAGKGGLIVWGVAFALIAFGVYLFMTRDSGGDGRGGRQRPPAVVEVALVAPHHFADVIEAIGTAKANESVVLTARVSETVRKVNFDDGMLVEEGMVLVELTNAEEVAQVSEASANVTEAKQKHERVADLFQRGNVSQATVDEAVRALGAARSRLAAAEARTADRIITAPFAGILGLRNVSPGTLVSPGTEITTLDDIKTIKLDFQVPERFLSALSPGQTIVTEAAAYSDRTFTGIVRTIGSRVDPITRALTIRAEVPNQDGLLRPGMLLTVDLISNERDSLAVMEGAILPIADEQFVFVIDAEGKAQKQKVVLGLRTGGYVEILSGVVKGERVVVSGTMRLRPGSKVRIKGEDAQDAGRKIAQRKEKDQDKAQP